MKTSLSFLFFVLLFCCCFGKKEQQTLVAQTAAESWKVDTAIWYDGAVPFEFDLKTDYPETAIRLSDLADIEYVTLGINDDFVMHGMISCDGGNYSITNNRIYMLENEQNIYIFDRKGNPVRRINRKGGGPEEYACIQSFVLDTIRQELFLLDLHNKAICVYDTAGVFKRKFKAPSQEIRALNDSLLICYNQYNPGGARYTVMHKDSGQLVKSCPIRFDIKLPSDSWGRLSYGSVMLSPRGALLSNLGNDTIFEIDKTLNIRPRIIDKSNYGTNFAQIHPTIETNEYILFYILRCYTYKPVVKQNFYVYDKRSKQIYKMKDYLDNDFFALTDNYPFITNWETTQQGNIAVKTRLAYALQEEETKKHCNEKLLKIIETLNDDSNPVLIVMNFKAPAQPF